jgi:8-oxo-dGTP diphosphatase
MNCSIGLSKDKTMQCPNCGSQLTVYANPVPTVDIIIEMEQGIVLIERKYKPLGWALPGGFVSCGESYEQAAIREAKEETGLDVVLLRQFHTYSQPDRDQRLHTASTVFIGKAEGLPKGADDALQAQIFTQDSLPPLVFDHAQILRDYFNKVF